MTLRRLFFGLTAILLVLIGVGARLLGESTWNAILGYRSPFTVPLAPAAEGPPLSQAVVLIVADGLRLDAFQQMSLPVRYRDRAAFWNVWTGEPSLSLPGWTTIVSGSPPEISGVTTNWYRGPVKVDHLFALARRKGLRTAAVGHRAWQMLFPDIERLAPIAEPPISDLPSIHDTNIAVTDQALQFMRDGGPRFMVVHYPAPDIMGHGYGGASQPYRDTVRVLDEEVARLLSAVDLSNTTVLFTADHGHINSGGHGGWERIVREVPLMMFGAGIEPGDRLVGRLADIAPTVAALLGLPMPAHSIGRPLVESLATAPEGLDSRWGAQQSTFMNVFALTVLGRHEQVFTTPLGGGDPTDAMLAAADELSRQASEWRSRALGAARLRRLPIALLAFGVLASLVLLFRPRHDLVPALAGTLVFFGIVLGVFFGQGYYYSLSVINREDLIEPFFRMRGMEAGVAIVAGALVAGFAARRRGAEAAAVSGLTTAFLTAGVLIVDVLLFYVLWGFRFPWYIPDLRQATRFYVDLLRLIPVGMLAPAMIVPGLVGFAAGRGLDRLARRGAPHEGERATAAQRPAGSRYTG